LKRAILCCLAALCTANALADEDRAGRNYDAYCSVCHGDNGDGASHASAGLVPPPRNFRAEEFAARATRESIIAAITNGMPGSAMIAWRTELGEAEIAELADYILGSFVGQGEKPAASGRAVATDVEAARTYQESCSVCHGDDGKGAQWGRESLAMAPRDFTTAEARRDLDRDRMIASVTYGRPGTPMPGFGRQLSAEKVAAVVDYVRARFMRASADTTTRASAADQDGQLPAGYHDQPFPGDLEGDFERGRAFYFVNCIQCHGADGAGDGPRAYFIFPKPRNFRDDATQKIMNRPRLYAGIRDGVVGKEMPAWSKVASPQEIADVSEFVYRQFIRSEAGATGE